MIKYILTFIGIVFLLLVGAWFYFPKDNPILGQWISTDDFYGKPQLLVFTEFGMLRDGRHVPADFVIGRQKVTVITNIASTEYLIVSENIIKQRVPRQTWRFFLRAEAFEDIKAELNINEVSRYSEK
ncbi:hypothetical protein [Moritella viscosa]|uniref:DUF2850 domain-containing protein n=1 Tax=Moritella viscosa TaxID=80854 RepID=A0ABY1HDS0_9GAMM|nr:hypothetical protein [Moritella viscosa]SGY88515.1 Putative uncharacterized protein [Moritella viscosa]SGY95675.1 Putative uncharacterized protein [Moritella viscosa]SHO25635.1 Putative uncharacterized protein [Moritella viscosa]